jgi:hypothetical protein
MHYAIPASLLTDPSAAVGWNTDLSQTDKVWSNNIYPYCPSYSLGWGKENEYLVGDWDGDHRDNIAVRRGNVIVQDLDFNGYGQRCQIYGNGGLSVSGTVDQYFIGDWDGDGKDNIAVRRGSTLYLDYNFDGTADKIFSYGYGISENQYLVGDWDGDGKDNIAVRRGANLYLDYNFDGTADKVYSYGNGRSEDQYLVGDWDGDRKDNIGVRRNNTLLLDTNYDARADITFAYGNGTR